MDTFIQIIPFGDFYKKDKAVEIIRKEVVEAFQIFHIMPFAYRNRRQAYLRECIHYFLHIPAVHRFLGKMVLPEREQQWH